MSYSDGCRVERADPEVEPEARECGTTWPIKSDPDKRSLTARATRRQPDPRVERQEPEPNGETG